MIDFSLSSEQKFLINMTREFANAELASGIAFRDRHSRFPKKQVNKMGELGLMGMMVPKEWGGSGFNTASYVLAIEEIAAVELATSTIMSVNNSLVCQVLLDWGNSEQKNKFLKPLAKGEKLGAYSLSEPQSGSDARNMKTFAKKNGNKYIINGAKNWVTSGQSSDLVICFCLTKKEEKRRNISCFIVDKNTPGLTTGKKEDKLGIRASDTCELYFDNCIVPESNLLGSEGQGFQIAMNALSGGRIGIAAQAVGLARSALEKSISYSNKRKQFDRPINSYGAIKKKIANMATNLEAARLLVSKAAYLKDQGKKYNKESSMAKLFASKTTMDAAIECVQIHGSYGYIQDYEIERLMRDAKITEIYEGTSEIQELVISRELTKCL